MGKSAWDYTIEIISLATDIDNLNSKLSTANNIRERELLSSKIDNLESRFFEVKDKLKKVNII
ncbi:hypothetical protein [Clostridium sp.]|uniref:hypothetical protein n=1 Tax=Clostridium sp. TaxID=1506 RepID=UPI00262C9074|nr:hypothetical protein [Clostridium sp.]